MKEKNWNFFKKSKKNEVGVEVGFWSRNEFRYQISISKQDQRDLRDKIVKKFVCELNFVAKYKIIYRFVNN